MKKLYPLLSVLFLIFGCSSPEPINSDKFLIEKNGIWYDKNTNKPYSGRHFSFYDNGKKQHEGTLKDGKHSGLFTWWRENGQKGYEWNYKNGEKHGLQTSWYDYDNGLKNVEVTYKDGVRDGLYTMWYENGQKQSDGTWKDGNMIPSKEWNEDGSVKEWIE